MPRNNSYYIKLLPPSTINDDPYVAEALSRMHRFVLPRYWIDSATLADYDYNCGGCLSEYLAWLAETKGKYGIVVDTSPRDEWDCDDDGNTQETIRLNHYRVVEPPLDRVDKWVDQETCRAFFRPLVIDALRPHKEYLIHKTADDEFLRILLQCFGFDDARTARPASIQVYAPLGEPMSIDLISSDMDPIYEYVARVDIVVHLPNHRDIEYIYDGEEYLDIIRTEPIDA